MPGGRRSWQNVHLNPGADPTATSPPALEPGVDVNLLRACLPGNAYLAPPGFRNELADELQRRTAPDAAGHTAWVGDLVLVPGPELDLTWVQNVWRNPTILPIASVGDAARTLKAIQRNWAPYPVTLHRRTQLIADALPHVSAKPLAFPTDLRFPPLGSFTLLDAETLLAAPDCSSPFPNGLAAFEEDHTNPPSRAYLKLWELFTRLGTRPGPGQRCLDLGASPGGWTWVLASLGASVLAVDKAPLEPRIAAMPGVESRQESAFGLDPASIGPVDWLFSDIICYPDRLVALIERWLASGLVRNFACSVKFQGATDWTAVETLRSIPNSHLVHLSVNRHELTWYKLEAPPS